MFQYPLGALGGTEGLLVEQFTKINIPIIQRIKYLLFMVVVN
jgi:hypothetical protein